MAETWKPIAGYEGIYEVSSFGRVKSLKTGKVLKPLDHGNGYLCVNLSKKGKTKIHLIHRLVAMAFVENPYNHNVVNHLDEDKQNNHAGNLEWTTLVDNFQYGTAPERRGMAAKGKLGKESKRHNKIVCVETGEVFYGTGEIKRKYNISAGNVISCCKGRRKIAGGYHWEYERR